MSVLYIIRDFPKVDHLGIDARIVLEQNKFSNKKLPLTGLELWTLGLTFPLMPYPCASSHCLEDSDFNDPYIVVVY